MSRFDNDSLGSRMKGYESVTKTRVMPRSPVIIRIDGKAFHTFTKHFKHIDPSEQTSPFGTIMHNAMVETSRQLIMGIQNSKIAYVQSDEISILLNDWTSLETEQWFNGGVQKIVSVAASIATAAFNKALASYDLPYACFDARVFNLPKEEVTNYFIWRQQDASRNSVQMLGHYYFSQKEMHCKTNPQTQDMLMLLKGVNWNDLDTWKKRGACIVDTTLGALVDEEIPIFTQDRNYIEKHLTAEE